jgi:hypothetical protein
MKWVVLSEMIRLLICYNAIVERSDSEQFSHRHLCSATQKHTTEAILGHRTSNKNMNYVEVVSYTRKCFGRRNLMRATLKQESVRHTKR